MAREAVVFHVAPDAGLETLAGGLPVTGAEEAVEIVVSLPERAPRHQAGRGVTGGTEARRIVAIAAARFARVGRRGVSRQEARGVIPAGPRGIGAVTLEAVGAGMTRGAGGRRGHGGGRMPLDVAPTVRRRASPGDHRPRAAPRTGSRQCSGDARRRRMAGQAALPGVTGGALPRCPRDRRAVTREKPGIRVTRRGSERGTNCARARVRRQSLDLRTLWRVDVTLQAELSRVAGRAVRARGLRGGPMACCLWIAG